MSNENTPKADPSGLYESWRLQQEDARRRIEAEARAEEERIRQINDTPEARASYERYLADKREEEAERKRAEEERSRAREEEANTAEAEEKERRKRGWIEAGGSATQFEEVWPEVRRKELADKVAADEERRWKESGLQDMKL